MTHDLTRRELLAGAGIATGSALVLGGLWGGVSGGGVATFEDLAGARLSTYRPAPGGVAIGVAGTDAVGTLAGGVAGPDGGTWALTCRHVVDPAYPDGDESEVVGSDVYQPTADESTPIGTVEAVGPSKGSGSTDWAALSLESDAWTPGVLGLGTPDGLASPTVGDRVVMSGVRTGLVGGEVTATSVEANWRGTLLSGLLEYRVDVGRTDGNSGTFVGVLAADGTFQPYGLHAFGTDTRHYAIPLSDAFDATGASLSSASASWPSGPSAGPYVEGVIANWGSETVVALANIGRDSVTREIVVEETDGSTVATATVTLEGLGHTVLSLAGSDGPPVLRTGDETEVAANP